MVLKLTKSTELLRTTVGLFVLIPLLLKELMSSELLLIFESVLIPPLYAFPFSFIDGADIVKPCKMLSELRLNEPFVLDANADFLRLDVTTAPVGGFNAKSGASSELDFLLENMAILSFTLFLLGSAANVADLDIVGEEEVLLPLVLFRLEAPLALLRY